FAWKSVFEQIAPLQFVVLWKRHPDAATDHAFILRGRDAVARLFKSEIVFVEGSAGSQGAREHNAFFKNRLHLAVITNLRFVDPGREHRGDLAERLRQVPEL